MRALSLLLLAGCSGAPVFVFHGDAAMPAPPRDLSSNSDAESDLAPPLDLAPLDLAPFDGTPAPPPVIVLNYLPGVVVSTFAGSGTAGAADGVGATVQLTNPTGLALDGSGNLYVAEYDGARVRRLDPGAASSTVLAHQANFLGPFALVIAGGALYVQTDFDDNGDKGDRTGTLWRLAGGVATVVTGGLGRPRGLAALAGGALFVSDRTRQRVGTVDPAAPAWVTLAGADEQAGFADAQGAAARFDLPYGAAALPDGSVVVADTGNHRLRRVLLDGTVTTFAGSGEPGTVDAPRLQARFTDPRDVAADAAGDLFVVDTGSMRVRRVGADGTVQTLAGDGTHDFADGDGPSAKFYGLESIEVTPDGKTVYVSDGNSGDGSAHHRIRKLTLP